MRCCSGSCTHTRSHCVPRCAFKLKHEQSNLFKAVACQVSCCDGTGVPYPRFARQRDTRQARREEGEKEAAKKRGREKERQDSNERTCHRVNA